MIAPRRRTRRRRASERQRRRLAAFAFTALSEAERAIQGTIEAIDFQRLAQRLIDDALARHQGRV
jgi:hypothetical protein